MTKNLNVTAPGGFTAIEDNPYLWGQSQTATAVDPGGTVSFSFYGDDADSSGNEIWGGVLIRLRRVSDGEIINNPVVTGGTITRPSTVNGSTGTRACYGNSDNTQRTSTVTFPDRGRLDRRGQRSERELELQHEPAARRLVPPRDRGRQHRRRPRPEPSRSQHGWPTTRQVPATHRSPAWLTHPPIRATAGSCRYVKWDANGNTTDGSAGFEASQLGNPLGAGVDLRHPGDQHDRPHAGATFAVRAEISDNGSLVAYDGTTERRTYTANTTVNTLPVATAQTVNVESRTPLQTRSRSREPTPTATR